MANFFHEYPYTDFHELNLDWVISEVKRLIEYFEGLDEYATKSYVDESIQTLETELKRLIDLKVDKTDYNLFVYEVRQSLMSIADALRNLETATERNAQAIIDTYNELKDYIDSQIIDLQVINPMTGITQPIQDVLNYMANLLRSDALTAEEYDDEELTAASYDALQLTAYIYDNFGKNYIGG